MKKIWYFFIFAFIASCNNFDFVYNDNKNLINPLYEKTEVITSGVDLVFINSYTPMFFGQNKQDEYKLIINIDEIKTWLASEKIKIPDDKKIHEMPEVNQLIELLVLC